MRRSLLVVCLLAGLSLPTPVEAQEVSPLAGVWTLNRSLSEMPREIGFNIDWPSSSSGAGQTAGSNGGGRGRRGSSGPSQLVVDVQFLERGVGDKARRVYEPGVATETLAAPTGAPAPAPLGKQPGETFDGRPGAELRGLKSLGILVEDLSAQAVACGLNHDLIEATLSKRLTDGGFVVRKNSDEDTYVDVNVMTTTVSAGTCVSRYDVFLYTHTTASLSYHDRPVLVQVSLMHRGGIGSSAPAAHAAAVARGLENYVDLVVQQIRDANK